MTSDWPPAAWEAINRLAELDLAHYPKHVHNREAFLGKARAERVRQHQEQIEGLLAINPEATADEIHDLCNPAPVSRDPEWARRRDYEAGFRGGTGETWIPDPVCEFCANTGLVGGGYCGCTKGAGKRALAAIKLALRPQEV